MCEKWIVWMLEKRKVKNKSINNKKERKDK
jgi:hypothetical protein